MFFSPAPIFLAFFIFALPISADEHAWEATLDSLVAKAAQNFEKPVPITLTFKNQSSLDPTSVAEIRTGLEERFRHRGFRIVESGGSATIGITLSENLGEYVWVARIHKGEIERVAIVSIPHAGFSPKAAPNAAISLDRRFVWGQDVRTLDFAVLSGAAPDAVSFVVLEPERLVFYKGTSSQLAFVREVAIAHQKPWPRDVRGEIDVRSGTVTLPGIRCSGAFDNPENFRCTDVPEGEPSASSIVGFAIAIEGRSVEAARLRDVCGVGSLILASGTGDWTEPDTVQAYVEADQEFARVGKAIELPGPVLAMWPSDDLNSTRIISRNLQQGTYEASIVSVSCNR